MVRFHRYMLSTIQALNLPYAIIAFPIKTVLHVRTDNITLIMFLLVHHTVVVHTSKEVVWRVYNVCVIKVFVEQQNIDIHVLYTIYVCVWL